MNAVAPFCKQGNLKNGTEQAHAATSRTVEVYVVKPDEVDGLLIAAFCGDQAALQMVGIVADTAAKIYAAPRKVPKLCLICGRPLRGPTAVCVIMPSCGEVICSGLCVTCADMPPERFNAKIEIAFKLIWPGARRIRRMVPEVAQ